MPTIAELEAKLDTVLRQLEEADQARVKAEELAEKAGYRALQAEGAAEKAIVESHIRAAALEAGSTAEPTAGSDRGPLDDVVRRMMIDHDWKADSQGKPFRPLPDGNLDYTSPAALMKKLRTEMPPLFPKHQGSDAAPGGAAQRSATGGAASTVNHWSRQHWNLTKQSEYIAQNGSDAGARMAAEAGSSLDAIHPPAK